MGHHRALALAARYHPRILPWNMGPLLTIAFMPFVTAWLAQNLYARPPAPSRSAS
jgi:uncharacterized membrane protein